MSSETPAAPHRVSFREGQVLRAADLREEQTYRALGWCRHHHFAHSAGIVAGLVLQPAAVGGGLNLGPGMALDASGRAIYVASPRAIDANDLERVHKNLAASASAALDLWIEAVESQPDCSADAESAGGPIVEGYRLCLTAPGSGDRGGGRVLLGTVRRSDAGRWRIEDEPGHVWAQGNEIRAASRGTRILLAPEGPNDPRAFAIGVRSGSESTYTDLLTCGTNADIRLAGGMSIRFPQNKLPAGMSAGPAQRDEIPPAVLRVAERSALLRRGELIQPESLLAQLRERRKQEKPPSVEWFLWTHYLTEDEQKQLLVDPASPRTVLALRRVLNRAIRGTESKKIETLISPDRRSGDKEPMRRRLLEATFPKMLAPLPEESDRPLGVTFAGQRAEPKQARPSQVYRTVVGKKDGPMRQELRIEFADPGKEGDPTRSRCVFGIGGRQAGGRWLPFSPVLTVDATDTVTVTGDLTVRTELIQEPPALNSSDPGALAALITALTPGNLTIAVAIQSLLRGGDGVRLNVILGNNSKHPLRAAQVHGSARNLHQPDVSAQFTVLQGESLQGSRNVPVDLLPFKAVKGNRIQVELLMVGLGPANTLVKQEATAKVTVS